MNSGNSATLAGEPRARGALDALLERGDHYALLNAALNQLGASPSNAGVTLLVCRSYIALGLVGPARDLLVHAAAELASLPEIQSFRARIARAPSGRVGWGSLQARFEANVARLYEKHPALCEHDAVFRSIPRQYELYRSFDGNLHVAARPQDGGRRWVPDLCDTKAVLANVKLPHDPNAVVCGSYLIAGDRLGALFNHVFEGTQKTLLTFTPRIYVLEPDVAAFGVSLYVSESVDRLCHERTMVLVGPDCIERLADYFEERPSIPLPGYAVWLTAAGQALCNRANDVLQTQATTLERKARPMLTAMHDHYNSLPADHWIKRFGAERDEPLRVFGITSRFTTYLQYSMRDWGAAFEARGHQFRVFIEENDHDLQLRIRIAEMVEEYKPDLILCIDHFRHEYEEFLPANVLFVGWVQDSLPHLFCRQCAESLGRLDFYIAQDARALHAAYDYPASQGLSSPMVTNEHLYSAELMADDELAPHRCDVSYVSNQSKLPRLFHEERRRMFQNDPAALQLADYLYESLPREIAEEPRTACAALNYRLESAKCETGLAPASPEVEDALLHTHLSPLAQLMWRQDTLEWVADYCDRTGRTLHLYGNGWEDHPRFAPYARGFAKNGAQLRAIHQASRINLQITSYGALHQRLLDGLVAGGFFLLRYSPTDVIREPNERYLDAAEKANPEMNKTYTLDDMPELTKAMQGLWDLWGVQAPSHEFVWSEKYLEGALQLRGQDYSQSAGAVFDPYNDVVFASADDFSRLADRYLADGPERAAITASMRTAVLERFTYGALVDNLLAFIGKRLGAEAESAGRM